MYHSDAFSPLMLVYADTTGHIVFASKPFLALLGYADLKEIIGKSIAEVLGISEEMTARLIQKSRQNEYPSQHTLELFLPSGASVTVECTSTARFNFKRTFIGFDLSLYILPGMEISHRRCNQRPKQIASVMYNNQVLLEQGLLRFYINLQLRHLQTLLAEMGGQRISDTMHRIIQKNHPNGQNVFEEQETTPEVYASLLAQAARYTSRVVGWRMVLETMQSVDGQIDELTRKAAERAGLRNLLKSHYG